MRVPRIGLGGKILIAMAAGTVAGLVLPSWGLRAVRTFDHWEKSHAA